jgi:hypothetical protein
VPAQRCALLALGRGVEKAWEQEKLEARKMLDAKRPTRQVHALLDGFWKTT